MLPWLLTASLLAAPPFAAFGLPRVLHLDDMDLARRVFENPAAADTLVMDKRLVLVARVESITRTAKADLFEVELGPRTTPRTRVACVLSRRQAAALARGQLVAAVGMVRRGARADTLRLEGCRIGYDFKMEPAAVAFAFHDCMQKWGQSECATAGNKCEPEAQRKMEAFIGPYLKAHEAPKVGPRCDNPVLSFLVYCVRRDEGEPTAPLLSCSQRSEIVDILNHMLATEDGKTRLEAGEAISVEKPERSALLEAVIRGGALPDEEP